MLNTYRTEIRRSAPNESRKRPPEVLPTPARLLLNDQPPRGTTPPRGGFFLRCQGVAGAEALIAGGTTDGADGRAERDAEKDRPDGPGHEQECCEHEP